MESRTNFVVKAFLFTLPAAALVVASVQFLDEPIALAVGRLIRSHPVLARYTSDIPDLLLPTVLLLSAAMWIGYARRIRSGIRDERTRYYRLTGAALPAAFFLKTVLKYVFGRINTRTWLENPATNAFLWFQGGDRNMGFPSGHMTVFAALAAASWIFFPRTRPFCAILLLALGSALILTDYHFLADVIAGAYFGWAVVAVARRALETKSA